MFEKQVNPIPHELINKTSMSLDLLQSAFLENPNAMCSFNNYDLLFFMLNTDVMVDEDDIRYTVYPFYALKDQ